MKARTLPGGPYDEHASGAPVSLDFDLVLLVEAEQLLSEGRFRAHQPVDRIVPVTAQHETHVLVVVEEANDDAIADLDPAVWRPARIDRCGLFVRGRWVCMLCFGNASFGVALGTTVLCHRLYAASVQR